MAVMNKICEITGAQGSRTVLRSGSGRNRSSKLPKRGTGETARYLVWYASHLLLAANLQLAHDTRISHTKQNTLMYLLENQNGNVIKLGGTRELRGGFTEVGDVVIEHGGQSGKYGYWRGGRRSRKTDRLEREPINVVIERRF